MIAPKEMLKCERKPFKPTDKIRYKKKNVASYDIPQSAVGTSANQGHETER